MSLEQKFSFQFIYKEKVGSKVKSKSHERKSSKVRKCEKEDMAGGKARLTI